MHSRILSSISGVPGILRVRAAIVLASILWIACAQATTGPIAATAQTKPQVLTVGQAGYALQPLTATGGKLPYVYEMQVGALPIGLSLDATTGLVTGEPAMTQLATSVVFRVRDAEGRYASTTSTVRFAVNSRPMATLNSSPSFVLTVGKPVVGFTPIRSVLRGTPPFTYVVVREQPTDSPLPDGLALNPFTGMITGTPTAPSPAVRVRIGVMDANGVHAPETNLLNYVVNVGPGGITATANTSAQVLAVGQAGYNFSPLIASGGTPPYTLEVASGMLPSGLGIVGTAVTGSPTAVQAAADVMFRVKDANGVYATSTSTVSFEVNTQVDTVVRLGQQRLQARTWPAYSGYAKSASFTAAGAGNASASAKISLNWQILIGDGPLRLFLIGPTGISTTLECWKTTPAYLYEPCELTADLSANPIAGAWTLEVESGGENPGSVYLFEWLEVRF